jgi:hypothetical protein
MFPFIKGMQLSELFFLEAVQPLLAKNFPDLLYSTARLDRGSDVLGFDTPQSMDHCWGPRLTIYLKEKDFKLLASKINQMLADELPLEIHGIPTHFRNKEDSGGFLQKLAHGPVDHYVDFTTIRRFFCENTGLQVAPGKPIRDADWLKVPQQKLRAIASGKIFYDGLGELNEVQQSFSWYPHDVWLYLMANQWRHIDQEEPFVGRCGDVDDELGSRLVASRLVGEMIRLCFLMERQYAPYSKWLGTAFSRLQCSADLSPVFHQALDSQNWKERERHLSDAYKIVMRKHNDLKITTLIEPEITPFFNRPYLVPHSARFVEALLSTIRSPEVKKWFPYVGSLDQFVHSVDVLDDTEMCRRVIQGFDME